MRNKFFAITLVLLLFKVNTTFSSGLNLPKTSNEISLEFDVSKYVSQSQMYQGKLIKVRAYEKIVYVKHPSDISKQVINIYIPEEYFTGNDINGFNTQTAPIFFPNLIGGYMPADPASFIVSVSAGPMAMSNKTILYALSKGYIVASAGARGRTTKNVNGKNIGKAPAAIVDLKAAIRYLKFNDELMPGDANKIISNGTSAGGAISSLLGASGNYKDFEPYLMELGAANAADDIFAVSAYCPIANLENADMAYEWQYNNINTFDFRGKKGTLSNDELMVSNGLKKMFPSYLNHLTLKNDKGNLLTLDSNGDGNFKDLVNEYIVKSAQKAINNGIDLSNYSFLKFVNNKVVSVDFNAYMQYIGRMKTPPAFDALSNNSFENNLFGTEVIENKHFTNYSFVHSKELEPKLADNLLIGMMNPMNYIGHSNTKVAKKWRIRHGAKDRDTGFAIPIILTTLLKNNGYDVDFAMPWDTPHSGDYDLDELFDWIDKLCK
jgi:hypothetical protein